MHVEKGKLDVLRGDFQVLMQEVMIEACGFAAFYILATARVTACRLMDMSSHAVRELAAEALKQRYCSEWLGHDARQSPHSVQVMPGLRFTRSLVLNAP